MRGGKSEPLRRGFNAACKRAGIEDFTFHDLRHTAINNWRLQGHDYFRIMAATGHKTMTVFKRYNTVSQEELRALVGENLTMIHHILTQRKLNPQTHAPVAQLWIEQWIPNPCVARSSGPGAPIS